MKLVPFRSTSILTAALLLGLSWFGCADQNGNLTAPPNGQLAESSETLLAFSTPVPQDVFDAAIEAQERRTAQLLTVPGVVGTAVGLSPGGQPTVKIYVETAGISGLPRKIDGIPVSVEVVGKIYALQEVQEARAGPRAKPTCGKKNLPPCEENPDPDPPPPDPTARFDRPVPIGVSTGHPSITAGTIGARVKDGTGKVYALSNNHVYAATNTASINDNVLQPGSFDGGVDPADAIGTLSAYKVIQFDGSTNVIDAAIAVSSTTDLGNATPSDGYGTPLSATVAASINQRVMKYGRTTGQTKGRVDAINATVLVNYGTSGTALFVDQVIIRPGNFSAGGDSGSLIVVEKGGDKLKPVGLLFAGSFSITVANPIDAVLGEFGVTIDGGP